MPGTLTSKRMRWLERGVGVVTVFAAVLVWQALKLHERHQVESAVVAAATSIQADLLADMASRLREQISLSNLAAFEDTTQREWKIYSKRHIELNPSVVAVMWFDNREHVRWVVPAAANQDVGRQAVIEQAHPALVEGMTTKQPRGTHPFPLPTGETVYLTVVPAFNTSGHVGSLVFVSDMRKALDVMMEDNSELGYNVAVSDGDREVYRLLPDSDAAGERWSRSVEVQATGVVWRVRVWPRREVLARLQSVVPEIMFVVVSMLGLALIFVVHFYRVDREKSWRLSSEIADRQRIEAALRASQERLAGVLDTSADAIISTDDALRITLFNQGAEQIFGYRSEEVMGQPLDILLPVRFRGSHNQHMARFAAGPQATMRMNERTGVFGLRKDGGEFPADAAISKLNTNGETVLTVFLRDVSARVAAEVALQTAHQELERRVAQRTEELAVANAQLRQLSGHLLRSQEDERRRIARELHDSTAGNLVFIGMTLDNIAAAASANEEIAKHADECRRWVQQTMEDIRTLSYRMHPPMLDGLGLGAALRWYTAGFSKRSGVAILLKFDPATPRLSNDMELALFRIVQESLTNVHRHSQSRTAEISVTCDDGRVRLKVVDHGVGLPYDLLKDGAGEVGVGIAGMSERIRQLGGTLEVVSNGAGTTVTAALPLAENSSAAARAATEPS